MNEFPAAGLDGVRAKPMVGVRVGTDGLVRPYVITNGRTDVADPMLSIEAAVVARGWPDALPGGAPTEVRRILELCRRPASIAELAAWVRLPVGVVRVLVADLVDQGLAEVGETTAGDEQHRVRLLERLLDGIRSL